MVHSKEEVLLWFRQQSASLRVETLCSLLECCVPFEVRFVGTVLENLGRRDFHELRDAEHRANSFMTTTSTLEENRLLLLTSLVTETTAIPSSNGGISQPQQSFQNSNLQHHSTPSPADYYQQSNNSTFRNQSISNPTLDPQDSSGRYRSSRAAEQQANWMTINEGHPLTPNASANLKINPSLTPLSSTTNIKPINGIVVSSGSTINTNKLIGNHINLTDQSSNLSSGDSEDDVESVGSSSDGGILLNDKIRRRMTLYLSLLTATNRDAANTFYLLMVSPEITQVGVLDRVTDQALAELALLYTIGFYHPAFTFNQHHALGEVLLEIRLCIHRREIGRTYYAQAYDPKTGNVYYYQIPPAVTAAHLHQVNTQHQQHIAAMQYFQQQPLHPAPVTVPQTPTGMPGGTGALQIPGALNPTPQPQGKLAIVDTTTHPNQPILPYQYPSNYPVFMGQSPPGNNPNHQSAQAHPVSPVVAAPKPPSNISQSKGVSDKWNAKKAKEKVAGVSSPVINGYNAQESPQIDHNQVHPTNRSRNISCFNCGSQTHYGQDCKESSMEDMTRHLYRLNFSTNTKAESS